MTGRGDEKERGKDVDDFDQEVDEEFDYDDEAKDPDFKLTDSDTDDDGDSENDLRNVISKTDKSSLSSENDLRNVISKTDKSTLSPPPMSVSQSPSSAAATTTENEGCFVSNVSTGKWAKKHACVYCGKLFAKITRHLEHVHSEESKVARALALTKRSRERQLIWEELRNRGDYRFNMNVIEKQRGEIIPCKRPADNTADPNTFLPCADCKGMFQKHVLWRHVKKCKFRSPHKKNRDHQKQGILLLPVPQDVSDAYKTTILGTLAAGQIRQVVSNDLLILQFGQRKFSKVMHRRHQHQQVRQSVRELGRFLVRLRDLTSCQNLQESIDPQRFNEVVNVIKDVCGFLPDSGCFEKPTLAQHIGQSLNKCAAILRSNGLKSGDANLIGKADGFRALYESEWTTDIGTFALNSLENRRFNKPKAMPLARDIRKLTAFLAQQATSSYSKLKDSRSSVSEWRNLSEVTLAQIVLFNRRRGGEAERALVAQFLEGTGKSSAVQEEIASGLSEVERHLVKILERFEIRGKRGRRVPVLLTTDHKKQLTCLVQCRSTVGVRENNEYLFPRTDDSKTPLRSCDVIRKFAKMCEAEHPEWISSTSLRKHIATMSQLLNLKTHELDALASFMGHNIQVHREFYRLPEDTMQLAKLSKILLQMEKSGNVDAFFGKTLDDITMDEQEKLDQSEEEDLNEDHVKITEEMDITEPEASSSRNTHGREKKTHTRQKWSDEEKKAISEHLTKFLESGTLPGKSDVLEAQRKASILRGRDWQKIKFCVKNMIESEKRSLRKKNLLKRQ